MRNHQSSLQNLAKTQKIFQNLRKTFLCPAKSFSWQD